MAYADQNAFAQMLMQQGGGNVLTGLNRMGEKNRLANLIQQQQADHNRIMNPMKQQEAQHSDPPGSQDREPLSAEQPGQGERDARGDEADQDVEAHVVVTGVEACRFGSFSIGSLSHSTGSHHVEEASDAAAACPLRDAREQLPVLMDVALGVRDVVA